MSDMTYFREKFKQLNFKVFVDDKQMQDFLERDFKSEDVLESLVTSRFKELEDKIAWLQSQKYYENERKYVIDFHKSLKDKPVTSLSQLEDLSKKIDQLTTQTEKTYNQVLKKVHRNNDANTLYSTVGYIQSDSKAQLNDSEKSIIQDVKSQLEIIMKSDDFKEEDVEAIAKYINGVSAKLFMVQQTQPQNFVSGEPFMFVAHNLTSSTDIKATDELYRKNFISASLITDKEMALYGNNRVGFIYSIDNNVIASDSKDIYSYNTSDDASQVFIGKYDKPTIKPPTQIEQECMQKTIDKNGEILNYVSVDSNNFYKSENNFYSEVVLDIRKKRPTGVFCVTNGEKELNLDYIEAKRLADEFGVPLVDIDISLYRSKSGLEPTTKNERIKSVADMLFVYYEKRGLNIDYSARTALAEKYSEQIMNSMMNLKNSNQYSSELMMTMIDKVINGKNLVDQNSAVSNDKGIDELHDVLTEEGYFILGHGTGRTADDSVVDSIFKEGLRTKNNSLYYTSIGLDTGDIEKLKSTLNNWQHLDSQNIILMKIPIEYINMMGDSADLDGERFGAFYNEKVDEQTGRVTYYLSPKYIIGNYNAQSQTVEINPNYEWKLTKETLEEIKAKYLVAYNKTQAKFKRQEENFQKMVTGGDIKTLMENEGIDFDVDFDFEWDTPKRR